MGRYLEEPFFGIGLISLRCQDPGKTPAARQLLNRWVSIGVSEVLHARKKKEPTPSGLPRLGFRYEIAECVWANVNGVKFEF